MNLPLNVTKSIKGLAINEARYLRNWRNFCDNWAREQHNPLIVSGYGNSNAWSNNKVDRMLNDIRTKLETDGNGSLLDAGCGSGFILKGLCGHFTKTVALDFSTGMLLHAKHNKTENSNLINGELAKLPFKADCFNRVLCYFVFINLPSLAYAKRSVEELIRVTKPGGLILIGQIPNSRAKERWLAKATNQQSKAMQPLKGIIEKLPAKLARLLDDAYNLQRTYKFYEPSFFEQLLGSFEGIKYEILDSFNPLYETFREERATADYRMDVKITTLNGDRQ